MNNNVNRAVALRISQLLKDKNITQYRLAMNSGITHSTLKYNYKKVWITKLFFNLDIDICKVLYLSYMLYLYFDT